MKCYSLIETFDCSFNGNKSNEEAFVIDVSSKEELFKVAYKFLDHYHCIVDGKLLVYNFDLGDYDWLDPMKYFENMLFNGNCYPYLDNNATGGYGFVFLRGEEIYESAEKVSFPWD